MIQKRSKNAAIALVLATLAVYAAQHATAQAKPQYDNFAHSLFHTIFGVW